MTETPQLSMSEREEILRREVARYAAQGWQVTYQDQTLAVVIFDRKDTGASGCGMDLLLTVVTFGMWLLVMMGREAMSMPRAKTLEVDEYGKISTKTTAR